MVRSRDEWRAARAVRGGTPFLLRCVPKVWRRAWRSTVRPPRASCGVRAANSSPARRPLAAAHVSGRRLQLGQCHHQQTRAGHRPPSSGVRKRAQMLTGNLDPASQQMELLSPGAHGRTGTSSPSLGACGTSCFGGRCLIPFWRPRYWWNDGGGTTTRSGRTVHWGIGHRRRRRFGHCRHGTNLETGTRTGGRSPRLNGDCPLLPPTRKEHHR
jgi:hypothetical protein